MSKILKIMMILIFASNIPLTDLKNTEVNHQHNKIELVPNRIKEELFSCKDAKK